LGTMKRLWRWLTTSPVTFRFVNGSGLSIRIKRPPINCYGLGVVKKSCHAMINMEPYYYATHLHR